MLANAPRVYPKLSRGLFLGQVRLAQAGAQPGMPQQSTDPVQNLEVNGATLQAQVGPSSQQGGAAPAAGGASPSPSPGSQTLMALIDSGASISCINQSDAQSMGLQQISETQLGGVGGSEVSPIYAAAITLPQFGVTVDPVQIAGVANPLPNVDMLIGRDILAQLDFNYNGGQGAFTLQNSSAASPAAQSTPTTQNQVSANPPTPGTVPPPPAQSFQPQNPVTPGTAAQPGAAPSQPLPQPPPSTTILGMSPPVAVGVGVLGAGAIVGGLFLLKVL